MNEHISPEDITRQFELAKLDYSRLGVQEQQLMNKRSEIWTKFFTILVVASGYAGVVGAGSTYVLTLVPFFITCLSIEAKHDEQVLRYDVRKQMKQLATTWGFQNLDSKYSNPDGKRWWAGYYKRGRLAAFLMAEIITAVVVSWGNGLLGAGLLTLNTFFILVTVWCLL